MFNLIIKGRFYHSHYSVPKKVSVGGVLYLIIQYSSLLVWVW